jgi:hypothetical protein
MSRGAGARIAIGAIGAAVLGIVCGVLLGISEIAYVVLTLLAILGGYFAGYEHHGAEEGALRGLIGGATFGGFILLTHEVTGAEAEAELPHPPILLVAITTVFGIVLGYLGGAARVRADARTEKRGFDLSKLMPGEFIGFAGAGVLFGSLFLPWFETNPDNENAAINGLRGDFTGWETFSTLDALLVAACSAPFILAWIVVRGHVLNWRPGEITMIVGMTAVVLILLNGIILGKPGEPDSEIGFELGYLVALAGAIGILVGGFVRQAEGVRARKPPGTV